MSILLDLYLVGIPLSCATLIWALWEAPPEDLIEVGTVPGIAAAAFFVLLWPVFLALCLHDVWTER